MINDSQEKITEKLANIDLNKSTAINNHLKNPNKAYNYKNDLNIDNNVNNISNIQLTSLEKSIKIKDENVENINNYYNKDSNFMQTYDDPDNTNNDFFLLQNDERKTNLALNQPSDSNIESAQKHHREYYIRNNLNLNELINQKIQYDILQPYENVAKPNARFFVMKSVNEDNIYKSIKYRVWCSSFAGNRRLNEAFLLSQNAYPIYLIFSVNKSGRFLGVCQMISEVNHYSSFANWKDCEKYRGYFFVVWICIKDIPNKVFKHIENK